MAPIQTQMGEMQSTIYGTTTQHPEGVKIS